ncbi:MAG: hypothetical protein AB4290_12055 [Spirulina sp.]
MFVESRPDQLSLEFEETTIVVNIAESFDTDLKKLSLQNSEIVKQKLEQIETSFEAGNLQSFIQAIERVQGIKLLNYTPSLYRLKVNAQLGMFLFFVDDPIFSQKIITFLRVFTNCDRETVLKSLVEMYYREELDRVEYKRDEK